MAVRCRTHGTVEAIFAVLATGATTGAEVGIYANRRYNYAEIKFNGEPTSSGETWTPAKFQAYEAEIPPEDPGVMLATSGKVPESAIKNEGWTEFKLATPVKVTKGLKYWLVNTTFQTPSTSETHIYQHFMHEQIAAPKSRRGATTPTNRHLGEVARPLKELPSPETTKINCEKCNTEGWLQEEPKEIQTGQPQSRRPGRRRPDVQLRVRQDRRRVVGVRPGTPGTVLERGSRRRGIRRPPRAHLRGPRPQ